MKSIWSAVALVVAHFFGVTASAEGKDDAIRGLGFFPCSRMVAWKSEGRDLFPTTSWIYGYWSAHNVSEGVAGRPMKNIADSAVSPDSLSAQLVAICTDNPYILIVQAADQIFYRLPQVSE